MDAFWKLSTCRQIGMGVLGPTPWDSIDRFAHQNDFAEDDVEYDSFVYIITQLDNAFLEHQREEQERESRKSGKSGGFRPSHARPRAGSSRKRG